jgi:hypothetical protein
MRNVGHSQTASFARFATINTASVREVTRITAKAGYRKNNLAPSYRN